MHDHGVRSIGQLRAEGLGHAQIARLVETGDLRRICRGWYALAGNDPMVVRGINAGGRLGCLSGCRHYGLWVPHDSTLHVAYGAGIRPRPRPGVTLHPVAKPMPRDAVWPLLDCLAQAATRHSAETGLIVLESALNLSLVSPAQVRDVIADLPANRRPMARFLSQAESGSETRVRLFLQQHRFPVTAQAEIACIGRVDLLVGDRLIIECDSDEHHRTATAHRNDRRRDLAALDQGLRTIRLSYHQIWVDWAETRSTLLRQLRTRWHLQRA